MAEERCETCRFREPDARPEYAGAGQCRRYPPTIAEQVTFDGSGANHLSQLWPWMNATDWCGEYRPATIVPRAVLDQRLAADAADLSLRAVAQKHGVGVGRVRGALARVAQAMAA